MTAKIYRSLVLPGLLVSLLCFSNRSLAQSTIYASGFDNASEQAGWKDYQLKSTAYSSWGVGGSGGNPPSGPNYVDHDYPVGNSNGDSVSDWYVSPAIHVGRYQGDWRLSLKANIYIIGVPMNSDYFGVWYSTTGADPAKNKYKELADLTHWESNTFTNWKDTTVAGSGDTGTIYIALKYMETVNWFTVGADDIKIQSSHNASIAGSLFQQQLAVLYPNPSSGQLYVQVSEEYISKPLNISIRDMAGREVYTGVLSGAKTVNLPCEKLQAGMYLYSVKSGSELLGTDKLIIK